MKSSSPFLVLVLVKLLWTTKITLASCSRVFTPYLSRLHYTQYKTYAYVLILGIFYLHIQITLQTFFSLMSVKRSSQARAQILMTCHLSFLARLTMQFIILILDVEPRLFSALFRHFMLFLSFRYFLNFSRHFPLILSRFIPFLNNFFFQLYILLF